MKMKRILVLVTISFVSIFQVSFAQTNQSASPATQSTADPAIKGFVYDKSTGETLIGAHIVLKKNKLGCATNSSGYFIIPDVPVGTDSLIVTYMGYEPDRRELIMNESWSKILKIYLVPSAYRIGEVVVTGDSGSIAQKVFDRPVSVLELSARQVNAMPRIVEADLLRALQSLPGITALSDFSSAIYVRGGTPDQNLYMVDGAEIYNPEHAFGIFSTFNTNAIKRVDVSKGGFGAEYGDKLSSVINVVNLDGNRNRFESVFNLSLIAADLTVQVPVGSIGSVSGSFRRTYIDQTYAKWSKDIPDYYFYDGNLKGSFYLSDRDNATVSYFDGRDDLGYKFNEELTTSPELAYDWGNRLGSVNWKHVFNDRFFSSFYATASDFSSDFSIAQSMDMREKNSLKDYSAREALEFFASNQLTLKFGAEYKRLDLGYNFRWDQGMIDVGMKGYETSAYFSPVWRPGPLWEIEGGLRFTRYETDRTFTNLDPRLAVKYRLSELSSLKFSTGIYHQYMCSIPRFVMASVWMSADKNVDDSRAVHLILGYNRQIGNVLSLEVETYLKDYKNIFIYNQNIGAEVTPSYYLPNGSAVYTSSEHVLLTGDGRSYGLEILMRKDIGAVSGWISYALARTDYEFDGVNQGKIFVPRQDRTSVVNFVLNGNIGDIVSGRWNDGGPQSSSNWILGLNFVYATGQPITVPASAYYINTMPDWNGYDPGGERLPSYKLYPGAIDSYRLPDYARMDMSLTWEKHFGRWTLAPYLQVFNIGNRQNVWFIDYSSKEVGGAIEQSAKPIAMLPILPTIGVTVKF